MNLQDFHHLLHGGKLLYEIGHKTKEFIDKPTKVNNEDVKHSETKKNYSQKYKEGYCHKCNYETAFLQASKCCGKHVCQKCKKSNYCKFCHSTK